MNLKDLETIGYVYIPNFLSATELKLLQLEYSKSKIADNKNYALVRSTIAHKLLHDKVHAIINDVNIETSIRANFVMSIVNYTDTSHLNFTWHQDHESKFTFQQCYDHLNFYIPIIKPDVKKSGLSVVSFEKLKECVSSDLFDKIVNGGATRGHIVGSTTKIINDETDEEFFLPVNLNDIAESPELNEGDLLLVRGDVLHQTQDADTRRVAMSIRAINGDGVIKKSILLSGSDTKKTYIKNNPLYQRILDAFDKNQTDEIRIADL